MNVAYNALLNEKNIIERELLHIRTQLVIQTGEESDCGDSEVKQP